VLVELIVVMADAYLAGWSDQELVRL